MSPYVQFGGKKVVFWIWVMTIEFKKHAVTVCFQRWEVINGGKNAKLVLYQDRQTPPLGMPNHLTLSSCLRTGHG